MDKFRVKFALQSGGDDICEIVDKFLNAGTFTYLDLCWWINPSLNWWSNRKQAKKLLKILKEEYCCYEISVMGGAGYKKTEPFVDMLHQILRIEHTLKRNDKDNA